MKAIEAIVMENLGPIALGVVAMFALIMFVLIYLIVRTKTNRKRIGLKPSVSRTRKLAREELKGEVAEVVEEAFAEAVEAAINTMFREKFGPGIVKRIDKYLKKEEASDTYATKTALKDLEDRRKEAVETANVGLTETIMARVTIPTFEKVEKDLKASIAVRASSEEMEAAQAELKEHRGRLEKLEGGLDTSLDSSPFEESSPHTRRASATMPPTGGRSTPVTLPPPASGAALAQEEPDGGGGPKTRVWEPPSEKKTQLQDGNGPGNVTLNLDPSDRKTRIQDPSSRLTKPGETLVSDDKRKAAIREPGDDGSRTEAPVRRKGRRTRGRRSHRRTEPKGSTDDAEGEPSYPPGASQTSSMFRGRVKSR